MLILSPEVVRFSDLVWEDVAVLAIDRAAARTVLEWSDAGPHPTFADVPERRTTLRLIRRLSGVGRDETLTPALGESGDVSFYTAKESTDAGRTRLTAQAVVTDVRYDLDRRPAARGVPPGATQTITLVLVSPDGASDPLIATPAGI